MLQHATLRSTPPQADVTPVSPASPPGFVDLRDRGRRAADTGRLDEALELFGRAYDLAVEGGDQELVDLAFCNRASVLMVVGRHEEVMTGLRTILMRGATGRTGFLAAYHLSRGHELQKSYKKGLFYGRLGHDRASALGDDRWLGWSANQIGNCLLAESYFEDAAAEYEYALDLYDDGDEGPERAVILDNLGYCRMMLEEIDEGMALSLAALRRLRRLGARAYLPWPHVGLSYGYLELGRVDRAERHAKASLDLAYEIGDMAVEKSALFMLGEIARSADRPERAHEWFSQLQRRYYPDSPQVAELMTSVSMRRVVNLRA